MLSDNKQRDVGTSGQHRGLIGGGGKELLPQGQQQLAHSIEVQFSLARLSEE